MQLARRLFSVTAVGTLVGVLLLSVRALGWWPRQATHPYDASRVNEEREWQPSSVPTAHPEVTTARLLAQAAQATPDRYRYALGHGARMLATPDSRSFFVVWTPGNADTATRAIATLSGHAGWAFDEFYLWHDAAQRHGCAIVALQWWLGTGERYADYYAPEEMYPLFAERFRELGLGQRSVLFHGFSRGATNTYALAFLDRQAGTDFFALLMANAGGYHHDFPIHRAAMATAAQSDSIMAGTRWALFAGGRDEHPERDGIPAMRRTAAWLQSQGGTVELFISDRAAGHGGFQRNPAHVESVMALFDKLTGMADTAPSAPPASDEPAGRGESPAGGR